MSCTSLTVLTLSRVLSISGIERKKSQFFDSSSRSAIWGSRLMALRLGSALFLAGQVLTQTPQPVQSSGLTWTVTFLILDASERTLVWRDWLQDWLVARPKDASAWQMLSRVQAALGQRLRSVRSDAEAHAAQLDFSGAAERFRAAQMLPAAERNADAMELAIIDVRRREVEALQRDSARQE